MLKKVIIFIMLLVAMLCVSFEGLYAGSQIINTTDINEVDILAPSAKMDLRRALKTVNVGNTVLFGHYEQDNNGANGFEPIEWIVLDKNEQTKTVVLISLKLLECFAFHDVSAPIHWEKSYMRAFLNEYFINIIFNEEERSCIKETTLKNGANPYNFQDGGNDTIDKLYIPSIDDMYRYFCENNLNDTEKYVELLGKNRKRSAVATEFAKARGVRALVTPEDENYKECANYFLRTSGLWSERRWYSDVYETYYQSYVSEYGEIVPNGTGVCSKDDGIRIMMQVYY